MFALQWLFTALKSWVTTDYEFLQTCNDHCDAQQYK